MSDALLHKFKTLLKFRYTPHGRVDCADGDDAKPSGIHLALQKCRPYLHRDIRHSRKSANSSAPMRLRTYPFNIELRGLFIESMIGADAGPISIVIPRRKAISPAMTAYTIYTRVRARR